MGLRRTPPRAMNRAATPLIYPLAAAFSPLRRFTLTW
jgi:hypothetical protein